jgi:hypothetical protein
MNARARTASDARTGGVGVEEVGGVERAAARRARFRRDLLIVVPYGERRRRYSSGIGLSGRSLSQSDLVHNCLRAVSRTC